MGNRFRFVAIAVGVIAAIELEHCEREVGIRRIGIDRDRLMKALAGAVGSAISKTHVPFADRFRDGAFDGDRRSSDRALNHNRFVPCKQHNRRKRPKKCERQKKNGESALAPFWRRKREREIVARRRFGVSVRRSSLGRRLRRRLASAGRSETASRGESDPETAGGAARWVGASGSAGSSPCGTICTGFPASPRCVYGTCAFCIGVVDACSTTGRECEEIRSLSERSPLRRTRSVGTSASTTSCIEANRRPGSQQSARTRTGSIAATRDSSSAGSSLRNGGSRRRPTGGSFGIDEIAGVAKGARTGEELPGEDPPGALGTSAARRPPLDLLGAM
ncbi:hypothetical protein OUZ56_032396 [Daphnia magna]|uniref:Uncharacterized protein n=1 Tax=Daphnia magna TaxID=35525 RepID=A0ABR0B8S0_9CRUS|nr:hypothetical protein OUZ56_032396 [Daphnia magna]